MTRMSSFLAGIASAALAFSAVAAEPMPKHGKLRFEIKTLVKDCNEACAVFDINRDGKLDVIAGGAWYEAPDWTPHFVRDMGVYRGEFSDSNGYHPIDLNGDGWVDIVSASWFGPVVWWYQNPGKEGLEAGHMWPQRVLAEVDDCIEGLLLDDLDGDGTPEVIVSLWEAPRPFRVIRLEPGRNGEKPKARVVEIGPQSGAHGTGVGDINGDGRKDIFIGKGWYEQPADRAFEQPWPLRGRGLKWAHFSVPCLIRDINGDKLNDIVLGRGHDYGLYWLEQQRDAQGEITWKTHEIDNSFSQAHFQMWADLDGDGRDELITGKRYRAHADADPGAQDEPCLVRYLWNAEKGEFERDVISHGEDVGTGMQVCVADLDGDKRLDIAVAGKSGTYLLFNRGPAAKPVKADGPSVRENAGTPSPE